MGAGAENIGTSTQSERLFAAGGVGACLLGGAAVWYFDPTKANFLPPCPLYTFTGLACPGCGMTRGFHALFNGDLVTALDFNAMIPIVILFGAYLFLTMLMVAFRGRGLGLGENGLKVIGATFVTLLVFGIVRNIPAYPFSILFP